MRIRRSLVLSCLLLLPVGALAAAGVTFAPSKITLQPQAVTLPGPGTTFSGAGAALLNKNCLLCHSPAFVDSQPALPPATWNAEVEKMRQTFGAPIDPAVIPDLVRVLTARHGLPKGGGGTGAGASGSSG